MTSDPDQVGIGSSFRLGRQVQQFSIMQVMQVISFRLCRYSSFRLRRWLQQFSIRFRSFRLVGIVPPLIDFKFIDIQRTKFHVFSAMGGRATDATKRFQRKRLAGIQSTTSITKLAKEKDYLTRDDHTSRASVRIDYQQKLRLEAHLHSALDIQQATPFQHQRLNNLVCFSAEHIALRTHSGADCILSE